MLLNCADFITEPNGNLVDALTGGNEKTSEGVPHDVRSDPGACLFFHVTHEGSAKIIAIKPLSVRNVWTEHEGFAKAVLRKKFPKLASQWYRAFLAIFEIHRGRFAKMKQAVGDVEPVGTSFDNLLKAQPGVETAKENKLQIVGWRLTNQFVAKFIITKILPGSASRASEPNLFNGISARDASDFFGPPEERPKCHDIAKSRISAVRVSVSS